LYFALAPQFWCLLGRHTVTRKLSVSLCVFVRHRSRGTTEPCFQDGRFDASTGNKRDRGGGHASTDVLKDQARKKAKIDERGPAKAKTRDYVGATLNTG
jgi:hypothetical protein